MRERVAFRECRNDHRNKCQDQEQIDQPHPKLIAFVPASCSIANRPLEKLENRPLCDPDEHRIEYPRRQNNLRTDFSMSYFNLRQAGRHCIVRAPNQNDMYQCHSYEKRYDAV